MAASEENYSIQLVDGDGKFNSDGIKEFSKRVKLSSCGLSYAVVSIMGPQSSGKSTLLNHLFGTNFRMMNALEGRSQTTKGIWLAKCSGIEPCTLVTDMEGTDGRERGEDDKVFEKQSALFALAVSDIVLINMWCQDVGREQAASKPLLKTVFQVMMQLFNPRKTTLLVVLRDQTRVAILRQKFINSIAPGGLAGDRKGVIPASEFGFSIEKIWNTIKENRNLDLPTHNVMVAKVRCESTANAKLDSFLKNMRWNEIEKNVQSTMVSGFGVTISSIIDDLLLEYDEECKYFDEGVRSKEREQLMNKLLQLVHPAYERMLHHIRRQILKNFKQVFQNELDGKKSFSIAARTCLKSSITQFDEQCTGIQIKQGNWDSSKEHDAIQVDMEAHIATIRVIKSHQLFSEHKEMLRKVLTEHVETLLEEGSDETWSEIRNCLKSKTESTINNLSIILSDFDVNEQTQKNMLGELKNFAIQEVQTIARRTSNTQRVLDNMKTRFTLLFIYDSNLMPRDWRGKSEAEIEAMTKDARLASLKLLSVMATIRLDENITDNIEDTLIGALMAIHESTPSNDLLISNTWEKVQSSNILIAPIQCKSIWWQFIEETKDIILKAKEASKPISSDEGNKLSKGAEIAAKVIGTTIGMGLNLHPALAVGRLLGSLLGGSRGRRRNRR